MSLYARRADPFLIFRLRRRTREQIVQELHKCRAGSDKIAEESEAVIPLNGFAVSICPPVIEIPLLKRTAGQSADQTR